jgi:hypothetical protein
MLEPKIPGDTTDPTPGDQQELQKQKVGTDGQPSERGAPKEELPPKD